MSVVDLKRLTTACGISMDLRRHQDTDEFLKLLIEQSSLTKEIAEAFQCCFYASEMVLRMWRDSRFTVQRAFSQHSNIAGN